MAIEVIDPGHQNYLSVASGKAARSTVFDVGAVPTTPTVTFYGNYNFTIRVGTVVGTGAFVCLWNNQPNRIANFTNIDLTAFFDGTAAATIQTYEIEKQFPTAGTGTILGIATPKGKITNQQASFLQIQASVQPFILGGNVVVSYPIGRFSMGRVAATTTLYQQNKWNLNQAKLNADSLQLAFGEALTISWMNTQVVGDNLNGIIEWYETSA